MIRAYTPRATARRPGRAADRPFHEHLADMDMNLDLPRETTPENRVATIATAPLTDNEAWTTLAPDETILLQEWRPPRKIRTA